jgi:hypothetical protein
MHRDAETRHQRVKLAFWACTDARSLWVPDDMLKVLVAGVSTVAKKQVSFSEVFTNFTHVVEQPGFSEFLRVGIADNIGAQC